MALHLSEAAEADAERIATVHMAAFGTNPMLRAQFPTPAIRAQLQTRIARKAVADIRDPKTAVLVVRDPRIGNEIISFAKWTRPILELEAYVEPAWEWPDGTNLKVLDAWTEEVDAMQQVVLGHSPFYRKLVGMFWRGMLFAFGAYVALDLTFIGTDPSYECRGAASLLLRWALEHCARENVPAYLEGTIDAGPLYERHGFKAVANLSMVLEGIIRDGEPVVYEETCFIFRPNVISV
jgi:GNAT superfamily N-acetyltransferase